jgi:hypothetical protein
MMLLVLMMMPAEVLCINNSDNVITSHHDTADVSSTSAQSFDDTDNKTCPSNADATGDLTRSNYNHIINHMARRLISPQSKIRKEYIVKVTPAVRPTAREREMGMKLPPLTTDLEPFLKGGIRLWNDAIVSH